MARQQLITLLASGSPCTIGKLAIKTGLAQLLSFFI
jgi:hypothetical protein